LPLELSPSIQYPEEIEEEEEENQYKRLKST
jgi:hypothetical protein